MSKLRHEPTFGLLLASALVLSLLAAIQFAASNSNNAAYAQTSGVTINIECVLDDDGVLRINGRIDNLNSIRPASGGYGWMILTPGRSPGGVLVSADEMFSHPDPVIYTSLGEPGREYTLQAVLDDSSLDFRDVQVIESESVTCPPPPPDPLAVTISADPTGGDAPLTVDFTASVTGGTPPYSYRWDFGDGNTEESIEPTTSHTYNAPESHTATLTVTDANGQAASAIVEVDVREPPEPEKTPVEQIADLRETINNMDISDRLKQTLQAPLTNIEKIQTDEDPSNDAHACEKLSGFISSVNGKTGTRGGLTTDQAEELINQAEAIQEDLGC